MRFLNKLIVFGCDFRSDSGEGFLANAIISKLKLNHDVVLYEDIITRFLSTYDYTRDRILPIYIFFICLFFLAFKKKIVVINYIPIWNFLNAILARLGANLGPVTGSVNIMPRQSHFADKFFRKYLQEFFIFLFLTFYPRKKFLWAATPSVINKLNKYDFSQVFFAFPFATYIDSLSFFDKDFDIFIYSSKHPIKNNRAVMKGLHLLISYGYRICYVGPVFEGLSIKIKCYSYLPEVVFNKYLSSSKLYISFSNEDAGITGMKALAYGLPVLCPLESGLAFMTSFDDDYTYYNPYETLKIANKAKYLIENEINFRDKSKAYFLKLKDNSFNVFYQWSSSL